MSERRDGGSRHLTTLAALNPDTLTLLLDRASELDAMAARSENLPQPLRGLTVANLFFEPSTRTRASFELAGTRLGAHVINLDMAKSSAVKGESLLDTILTLHAMRTELFVVRHSEQGLLEQTVNKLEGRRLAVVSAGEGRSDHPTQGLIDALALMQHFGDVDGLEVAIVGDIAHSRVARSAMQVLSALGAKIRITGPQALMPGPDEFAGALRCGTLDEALDGARVVMALRVQRERINAGGAPDESAYFADWGLTEARISALAPDAMVMHPGPFNRNVEIASDVADGPRSMILRQVALGVPVRMAVLEWLAMGLADGAGDE